ncbi:MAG: DUF1990 domain-containing protein [Magnetococcus sp. DMHC-6]
MFLLRKPTPAVLETIKRHADSLPFSYAEVGASRMTSTLERDFLFGKYKVLHHRIFLGTGYETFCRAREVFSQWGMFDVDWLELYPSTALQVSGVTVVVVGKTLHTWWPNTSRIIYTMDDQEGDVRRFGLCYGTLTANAVCGEERMLVDWNSQNDMVYYEIFSFSYAKSLPVRLCYPLFRKLQDRFAKESGEAILRLMGQAKG